MKEGIVLPAPTGGICDRPGKEIRPQKPGRDYVIDESGRYIAPSRYYLGLR